MPLRTKITSFWRSVLCKARLDRELDEELREYLDALVERKVRSGFNPRDARRAAALEMGGLAAVTQVVREARIGAGFDTLLFDVRHACRGLWASPGFALATILSLALGIGATTTIFSAANTILFQPLPYRDPGRLVFVWSDMTSAGYPRAPLSAPELIDLRQRATLFSDFGAICARTAALTADGDPEQLGIGLVTTNFFSVLGTDAALGRTLGRDDEGRAAAPGVVLSWALWQRRYGGDRNVIGKPTLMNDRPATIVGVMPAGFRVLMPPDARVPDDLQAWAPLPESLARAPRGLQFLRVVGRMRAGVALDQARKEIDGIASRSSREFAECGAAGCAYRTVSLQADYVRDMRPALLAMCGGVSMLLLIACVNVAGLLVARAAARARETAIRMSLGAGFSRLLRQCVVEGVVLEVLGAAGGLALARWGVQLLTALRPDTLSRIAAARVDATVLALISATALLWGLLTSIAALSAVCRGDIITALQRDARRLSGGLPYRTRAALVVVQLAFGVVLLVGAALMMHTFVRLQRVDPGFRSDQMLTFRLQLPVARYETPESSSAFSRRIRDELSALPGVIAVGAVCRIPYDNLPNWAGPYVWQRGADESTAPMADYRSISPGFFETVGVRLVDGRFFTESDDQTSQRVVIVDDRLARRAWPGASAVGKPLGVDPDSLGHPTTWATVVGVVHHLRHRTLVADLAEQVYLPEPQGPRGPMAYVLRTAGDPVDLAGPVRQLVRLLDRQLPVYDVRPFGDYVVAARATGRFIMILAVTFAAVALVLACVGVYGAVAYAATRRRHELGVRLALGARPGHVVGLVTREGLRLAVAGVAVGVVGAAIATHFLGAQLYEVTPRDLASYAFAVSVLGVSAILASWLPARRMTQQDPLEVLRTL